MRIIKPKGILIPLLVLLLLNSGCNKPKEESKKKNENSTTKIAYVQTQQSASQKAKKEILSMEEIIDVKAVNSDKEMFVAAKPKHLERFQLKSLRKKIKKRLEKRFPDLKVYVSTDQKILKKLEELENKLNEPKMNSKKIDKELQKIKAKATDEA
ncbi:YhcN/YlaJ family sporulation lipoprotein [Fictibacillus enclensis]|uniref:YhcN/YlaJ family sporulation lipoprotein n=1 Tax=Fictibacillus enclensis TaxID=1017270 RepID=UPI0025A01C3D|nr:YhcN/YlaJ family sporulation lipoprotein [Fictibacillus enclensis]MDM5201045.1 YhcN/YlaJ family sporulation lipoprotein [Fictibacillus enclensis]